MLKVAIIYPTPKGRPLSLAMVENQAIVRHVASNAISEAFSKAEELSQFDPTLGRIQAEEAAKLRHILGFLL